MNNKVYLAYGSNLHKGQMLNRCPNSKVLGTGILHNYRLVFRGARGFGVASIVPCKGMNVPVLLWSLPEVDEAVLDRYEGFPWMYDKRTLQVETVDGVLAAMAYIINPQYTKAEPSRGYLDVIREGYAGAAFAGDPLKAALRECRRGVFS